MSSKSHTLELKKQRALYLALILLIGTAVRAWVLFTTENGIDFHFNAYDRAIFTWNDWMQSDRWIPIEGYGPFQFYLLRFFFSIIGYDPLYTPRILSLVFGVLTLWPLFGITRHLFGDKAAFWAGLAGAFYPLGVRLSAVSLEATIFHFFVLMSILVLVRVLDTRRASSRDYVVSALWLNLACATRFEGWLLIPVFVLLCLRKSFWRAVIFGAVASIFPVFWMVVSKVVTGNPIAFATSSAVVQKLHSGAYPFIDRLFGWPKIFVHTSTIPVVFLILAGLFVALRKRKGGAVAAAGLWLFVLFVVFSIRGTMALNETKYIATVALLLLPFFGLSVEWIVQALPRNARTIAGWTLAVIAIVFSLAAIQRDNRLFAPPPPVRALADYLSGLDEDQGRILLGVRFQGYLLAQSGLVYDRFVLVPGDDATGHRSEQDFWRIVNEQAPCLLIHNLLTDRLDFQELIPIDGEKVKEVLLQGYQFSIVWRQGPWMVLSVAIAAQ